MSNKKGKEDNGQERKSSGAFFFFSLVTNNFSPTNKSAYSTYPLVSQMTLKDVFIL